MRTSRRNKRVFAVSALVLCLACLAIPALAWAGSVNTPSAPESNDGAVKNTGNGSFLLFGDMIAAGQNADIANPDVPANLIAAAQRVRITGGAIGADAILAGADVILDETTIANNAFLAGETVDDNATIAGAVNAVGRTVHLRGQAWSANAAGELVTIDGSFAGDVSVHASEVVIGENTVIKGTLAVEASSEPSIPPSADIADYTYTQGSSDAGDVGAGLIAFLVSMQVFFVITGILGLLLFAVALLLLMTDRPFVAAGNELRTRPARVLLTGFIVMLLVPVAAIVLFAIAIGWRIAIALLLACGVLSMICGAFSALALGFMAFKKMNRWGAGLLMALIFGIVGAIPILGTLLNLFCSMFAVGYICTRYYDWRKGRAVQNMDAPAPHATQTAPQPPAGVSGRVH